MRKSILVVEDDASVRDLVTRALRGSYDVYEAADGIDALEQVAALPRVDLIVSDVSMPRADGFKLAEKLRSGAGKGIPIVFLTARGSFLDVVAGINAGARQYVTKPFKLDELRTRIARILR